MEEVKHQEQRWSVQETVDGRKKREWWVRSARNAALVMDWYLHQRFHPEVMESTEEQKELDRLNDRLYDFRKSPLPFWEETVGNTTYTIVCRSVERLS